MTRHFWLLIHRYAGLYMAFFLTVAGLTGSVLAFYHELDGWLNPERHRVAVEERPMLDELALRDKALALAPQARINSIRFRHEPGDVFQAFLTPRINPDTGKAFELANRAIWLNPYSGALTGFEENGFWPLTRHNILRFIYRLHYSLALEKTGVWLFGIAALIWTLDCLAAFYLTLPNAPKKVRCAEQSEAHRSRFWARWAVAWKIKWPASPLRFNFDLHRAGGLWTWPMLFVFAWSSVAFNLGEPVYRPVMRAVFDLPDFNVFPAPNLPKPQPDPTLDWPTAQATGRRLMAEQARLHHFKVYDEVALAYQPAKGLFFYLVKSDLDINTQNGSTIVWFDGKSGAFVNVLLPSGWNTGVTISQWLVTLHRAKIWGLPFQIFVCLMGLVVAMLSVTGVYIWLKKRRAVRLKGAKGE